MKLEKPELKYQSAFIKMAEDYHKAGEDLYSFALEGTFDFEEYLKSLRDHEKGLNLEEGYVPDSHFWLIEDGRIVGVSRLRHKLTGMLKKAGGHIGYDVSPSQRGKGYATELLALTLKEASEIGIQNVLVTCKSWNKASARVIEKNGGVFASSVILDDGQEEYLYWISVCNN